MDSKGAGGTLHRLAIGMRGGEGVKVASWAVSLENTIRAPIVGDTIPAKGMAEANPMADMVSNPSTPSHLKSQAWEVRGCLLLVLVLVFWEVCSLQRVSSTFMTRVVKAVTMQVMTTVSTTVTTMAVAMISSDLWDICMHVGFCPVPLPTSM